MKKALRERAYEQAGRLHRMEWVVSADLFIPLVFAAACYWETFEPSDFCIQRVTSEVIMFGNINRLSWTPATGFRPDRIFCSKKFLAAYDKIGPLPGIEKYLEGSDS